jgi:hypothetical protein
MRMLNKYVRRARVRACELCQTPSWLVSTVGRSSGGLILKIACVARSEFACCECERENKTRMEAQRTTEEARLRALVRVKYAGGGSECECVVDCAAWRGLRLRRCVSTRIPTALRSWASLHTFELVHFVLPSQHLQALR